VESGTLAENPAPAPTVAAAPSSHPGQVPILPSISVITPTYNQAGFIRETVESVREQAYPALEHIVIDGLSTDDTLEVLCPYGDALTVVSEADSGQTEAINKGLKRASNDVICWLNSDDYLLPGALQAVGEFFAAHPDVMWVTGDGVIVDVEGRPIQSAVRAYKKVLRRFSPAVYLGLANGVVQPATFWRREVHDQLGFLDESLHYTMDYDWWLRLLRLGRPGTIDRALCGFRIHDASKSGSLFEKMLAEDYQTYRKHSTSTISCLTRSASATGQTIVTSAVCTTTLSRTPTSATRCSGSSLKTMLPAASRLTTSPRTALPSSSPSVCASAGQDPTSSQSTSRSATRTRPGSAAAGSRTA
jgi:GT2 family glycosyltransferase